MSKPKKLFEAHVVTLGNGQVGKTSLILRYIDDTFSLNYLSTIGIDSKIKKINMPNGEQIKVKISDTAGQERFKSIAANYIKKAHGIILVYDITCHESFQDVNKWLDEIGKSENTRPMILIGNKSDMADKREVPNEEGMNFAKNFGQNLHFYETSCKTGENVEEAINDLVNQIYNKYSGNSITENIELKHDKNIKNPKEKKKCC